MPADQGVDASSDSSVDMVWGLVLMEFLVKLAITWLSLWAMLVVIKYSVHEEWRRGHPCALPRQL